MDGPPGSRVQQKESATDRMRSCVRPVGAAHWPLAQMGSANDLQTRPRHRVVTPLTLRHRRAVPAVFATPIRFPVRHYNPDDPGHLVGQPPPPPCAACAPAIPEARPRPTSCPARRSGPPPWRRLPEAVAGARCSFADPAQPSLASRRMLLWCHAEPGSEVCPDSKLAGLTVNAMVVTGIGPTPGMSASNRLTGLALCRSSSC